MHEQLKIRETRLGSDKKKNTCVLCCMRLHGVCQVGRAQQKVGFDCGVESVLSDGVGWSCGRSQAIVAAHVTEFALEASLFLAEGVPPCWRKSQRAMPAWRGASRACWKKMASCQRHYKRDDRMRLMFQNKRNTQWATNEGEKNTYL